METSYNSETIGSKDEAHHVGLELAAGGDGCETNNVSPLHRQLEAEATDFLAAQLKRFSINSGDAKVDDFITAHNPATLNKLSHKLVAERVNELTQEERDREIHELHGVLDGIDETPELLQESLDRMETELQHLLEQKTSSSSSHNTHAAFSRAAAMDAEYVKDRDFRLAFLRTDRFVPKLAAERCLKYFEAKEYLFGTDLLTTDIQMEHLGEYAMAAMDRGGVQILPERDSAGRAIIISIAKVQQYRTNEEQIRLGLRALWKLKLIAIEDVNVQRRGAVNISYCVGCENNWSTATMTRVVQIERAFPLRCAAGHLCYSNPVLETVWNFVALLVPSVTRFRLHCGSHMEVQYKLMTFGIPHRRFPVSVLGDVNVARHKAFVRQRIQLESHSSRMHDCSLGSTSSEWQPSKTNHQVLAVVPSNLDVCLGRGIRTSEHDGNVRYRRFIEQFRERYEGSKSKKEKAAIIREVVQSVHDSGARFLKQEADEGPWVPVDFKQVCVKVSQSFRNHRRLLEQKMGMKMIHSHINAQVESGQRGVGDSSPLDVVFEPIHEEGLECERGSSN